MSLTNPDRNVTVDDLQYYEQRWVHHNLATIEPTTTASKAYAIGDYLVYSGQFYKVTSPISSGGTIVTSGVSANVEATTVTDEIGTRLISTVSGTTLSFTSVNITANSILEGPYILNGFGSFSDATYTSATNTVTYTLSDNSCDGKSAILIIK